MRLAVASPRPRTRGPRAVAVLAATGMLAASLSSCSTSVPRLEDTWGEVRQNIQDADSVTVTGDVVQDGEKMEVRLSGQVDDSSYEGVVVTGPSRVELRGQQDTVYLRPNEAFFAAAGHRALSELADGRWLPVDPSESDVYSMSKFYANLSSDLIDSADLSGDQYTAEGTDLDGQQVYRYSGSTPEGQEVAVFVTKDRELARVELSAPKDGEETGLSGAVTFSDWNEVPPVEMPAEDEVFSTPGM